MLKWTEVQIHDLVGSFIWNYKVGDNIEYNCGIMFALYRARGAEASSRFFNKPLIIQIVCVVECLMRDLVMRLDQATNEFPTSITYLMRQEIKQRLDKDKEMVRSGLSGVRKVKNYALSHLIGLFEKYDLLGDKSTGIYQKLREADLLRNRIHIFNWHGNFEVNERDTYMHARLVQAERLLEEFMEYMAKEYARP